jgi:hypothetical protein
VSLEVAGFVDLGVLLALEEVVGERLQKRDDRVLLLVARAIRSGAGSWMGSGGTLAAFRISEGPTVPTLPPWAVALLGAGLLLAALSRIGAVRKPS